MQNLLDGVCRILRATARGNHSMSRLRSLDLLMRRVIGKRLRNGVAMAPIFGWEGKTEAIRTVMTINHHAENCVATSIAVTIFSGGVLTSSRTWGKAGTIQFQYSGNGKAFKFIRHDVEQSVFAPCDFHDNCFPYKAEELVCAQGECGTLALVKGAAKPAFTMDCSCMVSAGRIEDFRLYTDRAKLAYDLVTLYEEVISSDDRSMRDMIFRALF